MLSRITQMKRDSVFADIGITGTQHGYILAVCREPGITQHALAHKLFVNKSNVARQIAQLDEQGYLTKRADPDDKRMIRVYPTDKAWTVYPLIERILEDWNAYLQKDMSVKERETLSGLLSGVLKRAVDALGERDFEE